ncbi:aminoacetone oxidase family FAD-binding enzyme [Falsiroseomonas bella]|uniref:Aminoacetone oxidase family FAD-binding enzyme n=1 Tax=Falsiroseomonas bella TaxID=2184016 RepID=A0A317FC37_9PROT|nr:TIGR03862 family flavoprotein [Falsiroseomonas bella]PWS35577.1 aminoacetone oxidase family FAD-binding enzyme [Falsiroseomonas bella]
MPHIAVIGAGPAGLIAAEILAQAGCAVTVFESMPSAARKFLMAGRGGLNLTHSEPLDAFLARYRPQAPLLLDAVRAFPPSALIAWCEGLGIETFVGSSGRVFPKPLKASPLLRAWLRRLATLGVEIRTRHRCIGLSPLRFGTPEGETVQPADAVLLACGGASWPRLGSDGGWTALLPDVSITPFAPTNAGVVLPWSDKLARLAGTPLKRIAITHQDTTIRGEAMLTASGLEGGAVYALSAPIREAIARDGEALLTLDLRPDMTMEAVRAKLATRGRGETVSTALRKALALPPVAIALIHEARHAGASEDLATLVKALPLTTRGMAGLQRAISSAGGIAWSEFDDRFMLRRHPGIFAAGEMLDWEAPTGGYLLQACFATGVAAARGVLARNA